MRPHVPSVQAVVPGLALAVAVAAVSFPVAASLGDLLSRAQGIDAAGGAGAVSPVPVAVVLGLVLGQALAVGPRVTPGLGVAVQRVLKLGIVLVGLKLSFFDVLRFGALGVPVVVSLVAFAFLVALGLARLAGVSERLGSLAAASTAICGITATLAVAPSIEADEREVAATVANVTVFGLVAMLLYPHLALAVFPTSPVSAGLFLGTAIHDTSQVMGAALTGEALFADPRVLEVATVAKLTRNTLLIAIVPLLGWLHRRRHVDAATDSRGLASLFPMFVLGFLALSVVRTVGDVVFAEGSAAGTWHDLVHLLGGDASSFALATALAAVGLQTRLRVLRELGPRPFLVGLGAAVAVGAASLMLAFLVGPYLGS